MKLAIVNGPNLNLLGSRQVEIYGHRSFEEYLENLRKENPDVQFSYFQSNHEGAIIDYLQEIQSKVSGIIINPAAYTHYSYAIADTLALVKVPIVEVHISDIDNREDFRKKSVTATHCIAQVKGKGLMSYTEAVQILKNKLS